MAVTTSGAEFKRFYRDPAYWPEDGGDTWHEDVVFSVDGKQISDEYNMSDVPDAAKVSIDGGLVFSPKFNNNEPSFETYFKRWRKAQTTQILMIEADQKNIEAIKAAIKAAGGKIVG